MREALSNVGVDHQATGVEDRGGGAGVGALDLFLFAEVGVLVDGDVVVGGGDGSDVAVVVVAVVGDPAVGVDALGGAAEAVVDGAGF